jgi:predicted DNA-binding transcriptional regulator YafY
VQARPAQVSPGLRTTASTDVLATLAQAIDEAASVWIGYVDNHGTTSERIVDPVSLDAGWLSAFDHRTEQVRTFAVHRITGVAATQAAAPTTPGQRSA